MAFLVITQRAITITAVNRDKYCGQTVIFAGTEFTATGLVNGDLITSVTLTSAGAVGTAILSGLPIIPSAPVGTGLGNYNISYFDGILTIKSITIDASASSNPTRN